MTTTNYDLQAGKITPLIADSDGSQLNLFPGFSTGLGRAVVSVKKSGTSLASSSTTNPFVDGLIVGGFKLLTDNVAVNLVSLMVDSNTLISGIMSYSVEVYDGTNLQVETGLFRYLMANKAGVFTKDTGSFVSPPQVRTSGTLSVTFALSSTNPALLSVNANTSLSPNAGFPRINFSFLNLANQGVTPL